MGQIVAWTKAEPEKNSQFLPNFWQVRGWGGGGGQQRAGLDSGLHRAQPAHPGPPPAALEFSLLWRQPPTLRDQCASVSALGGVATNYPHPGVRLGDASANPATNDVPA